MEEKIKTMNVRKNRSVVEALTIIQEIEKREEKELQKELHIYANRIRNKFSFFFNSYCIAILHLREIKSDGFVAKGRRKIRIL